MEEINYKLENLKTTLCQIKNEISILKDIVPNNLRVSKQNKTNSQKNFRPSSYKTDNTKNKNHNYEKINSSKNYFQLSHKEKQFINNKRKDYSNNLTTSGINASNPILNKNLLKYMKNHNNNFYSNDILYNNSKESKKENKNRRVYDYFSFKQNNKNDNNNINNKKNNTNENYFRNLTYENLNPSKIINSFNNTNRNNNEIKKNNKHLEQNQFYNNNLFKIKNTHKNNSKSFTTKKIYKNYSNLNNFTYLNTNTNTNYISQSNIPIDLNEDLINTYNYRKDKKIKGLSVNNKLNKYKSAHDINNINLNDNNQSIDEIYNKAKIFDKYGIKSFKKYLENIGEGDVENDDNLMSYKDYIIQKKGEENNYKKQINIYQNFCKKLIQFMNIDELKDIIMEVQNKFIRSNNDKYLCDNLNLFLSLCENNDC